MMETEKNINFTNNRLKGKFNLKGVSKISVVALLLN